MTIATDASIKRAIVIVLLLRTQVDLLFQDVHDNAIGLYEFTVYSAER